MSLRAKEGWTDEHGGAEPFVLRLEFEGSFAGQYGGDQASGGAGRDVMGFEGTEDHFQTITEAVESR